MTTVDLSWKLTWDGHSWTVADLTAKEVADLAVLLGDRWEALSPRSSPVALMSHIAVRIAYQRDLDLDVAVAEVQATPIVQLFAALDPSEAAGAVPTASR